MLQRYGGGGTVNTNRQEKENQTGWVRAGLTAQHSPHFRHWGPLSLQHFNECSSPPPPPLPSSPHPRSVVVWQQQQQWRNVCRTTWHTYQSKKTLRCHLTKSVRVRAALCAVLSLYFYKKTGLVDHFILPAPFSREQHGEPTWAAMFTKIW